MDRGYIQKESSSITETEQAVELLRDLVELRRVDLYGAVDKYPGGLAPEELLRFTESQYGKYIVQGIVTPGMLARHDYRLYRALDRLAKRDGPQRMVKDIFADLGYSPAERIAERAHALATILNCSEHEAVAFVQSLQLEPAEQSAKPRAHYSRPPGPHGPDRAPTLWSEGRLPKETPPAFIERVYAEWLDGRLTRADLQWLDRPLYGALGNWLRSNSLPPSLDLPTNSERAVRWAEKIQRGVGPELDSPAAARRYADALARRQ